MRRQGLAVEALGQLVHTEEGPDESRVEKLAEKFLRHLGAASALARADSPNVVFR
jgi:hypothetical protein